MKRIIYILAGFIILISCKPENKLEGIWIGAYQINYLDKDTSYSSMRLVLDISNDELLFKTFDYPMFGEKDTVRTFKYSVVKNSLMIDSDTFFIKSLTKDSMILRFQLNTERNLVFKRLINKNKNLTINLENKAFSMIGPNYADSIDFINDSLIIHIGNSFNTNYRSTKWTINRYKSFDFLVFNQLESPPLLVDYSSENEISLKLFYTTTKNFKMTQIENVINSNSIVGNWVCLYKNSNDLSIPPPPSIYPDSIDSKLYLRIRKDTLETEQYGRINSKIWKLNSTNKYIYFPENIMTKYGVWKILKIEDSKLIIERNKRFSYSINNEILEFKRVKNKR